LKRFEVRIFKRSKKTVIPTKPGGLEEKLIF
jgi:hypothetical protein